MIINGKEMVYRIDGEIYHCALDVTMDHIGGKWKTVILWYLRKDKKRFSELKKLIPDITERMLSLQLKQLEASGLIRRKEYAVVPPKVEYSLTKDGTSLVPMLELIAEWGRKKAKRDGELIARP